ncbi:MAG TPA: hypothetical protein IAC36_04230 [Candidatus Aphodomonas merdavium]|nr:hypothetical protein [Candidatus Aphodomonas merdavium]
MKVFSTKKFEFLIEGAAVCTRPFAVVTLPDAVEKTPLFQLALREGSLEVVGEERRESVEAEGGQKKPARRRRKTVAHA